jgi:hypothetical protein
LIPTTTVPGFGADLSLSALAAGILISFIRRRLGGLFFYLRSEIHSADLTRGVRVHDCCHPQGFSPDSVLFIKEPGCI